MKPTRSERKLIVICALAICVPLGVAAFIGHINATPTIAATPTVKPPNPNGYDSYVAASNAIKPANPPVDANLDPKPPTDPKLRAQRYSVARKDAWLAQNKAGFALFERAQQEQSLAPPYGAKPQSKAIRQMARYKAIESNAHWQRGDYHAALQSGLDVLQLGHDARRGGDAYDFLVGSAIGSMSHVTTGDTIEHLNALQAKDAARRVEKLLDARWTLQQALIEDSKRSPQRWLEYFENPEWRANFLAVRHWLNVNYGSKPLSWNEKWQVQTMSKRQIIADCNQLYKHAIANAPLPYAIEGEPPPALANPFATAYPFMSVSGYNSGIRLNAARDLTADRVLMLRLALRTHQLERGALPPNLQALVPNHIKAVPVDPFGKGAPFLYKTDGKTYRLWSIGPDGRDDGGKPIGWLKNAPRIYADGREKLPRIWSDDSLGDYVAGKNH